MQNPFHQIKLIAVSSLMLLGLIAFGCDFEEQDNQAYVIVPNQSVGLITPNTSRAELEKLYGASNVLDQEIHVAEGFFEKGTVLFPNQPSKKLEIFWQDPKTMEKPATIRITQAEDKLIPVWQLDNGIQIGTDLIAVQNLNKKPFKLYGFSWDYGGTVSSFNGGELDKQKGFSLVFNPSNYENKLVEKVIGDSEFSSDLPAMRKLNPQVVQMTIYLNKPLNEQAVGE